MTSPRSALISLDVTPYYHCVARCVRRAFLCGKDKETGRSFDHRKTWLVQRIQLLGNVFAINIAAYAVMSNHYHLVLHVDTCRSEEWSHEEVINRWNRLYRGPELVKRFTLGETLSETELEIVHRTVEKWRSRLSNISWFMSCLNYYIALNANKEDGCKGRFWEGRFNSKALLDDAALLSCMAYVDLNPIRAGIADSLDASAFTSIQDRIRVIKGQGNPDTPSLMTFAASATKPQQTTNLPYKLKDYIDLVDWTGRAIRDDKKGYIKATQPSLLKALGLSAQQWQILTLQIQKKSICMLHGLNKLQTMKKQNSQSMAA